ncbi:1-phosphatidylinositol 4,5-bisphosphate phosphodiesterase gamma-1, partial [Orchesella cincta]
NNNKPDKSAYVFPRGPAVESCQNLKIYRVDVKLNIYPVLITADTTEYYQLKIEKQNIEATQNPEFRNRKLSVPSYSRSSHQARPETEVIPLLEIKDLRIQTFESKQISNQAWKQVKTWNYGKKCDNKLKLLVIHFGKEFNLKKYTFLVAEPEPDCDNSQLESWITGMKSFIENLSLSYFQQLDLWYRKQFEITTSKITGNFRPTIWKQFLYRFHYRMSVQSVFDIVPQDYSRSELGELEQMEFNLVSRHLVHSYESITSIFERFANEFLQNVPVENMSVQSRMLMDMFSKYFKYVQGCTSGQPFLDISSKISDSSPLTKDVLREIGEMLTNSNQITCNEAFLCSHYVLDYLFCEDNSIWDPEKIKLNEDIMDRPLSHYWIASSHNTFLTGDQYSSQSSVEAYARALRQGCRCIEIDVWNGNWNKPIVTHGMTLTTSVNFKDVLETIKENAFVASDKTSYACFSYPLIISIENHCNLKQQKVMAKYFRRILGRLLLSTPLEAMSADGSPIISKLPSPNQLKNKIILKGRKLPYVFEQSAPKNPESPTFPLEAIPSTSSQLRRFSDNKSEEAYSPDAYEGSGCDCLKTGELLKQKDAQWAPYIFVLTNKKLFYTEKQSEEEPRQSRYPKLFRYSVTSVTSNQELHVDQIWFHGKIPGGRATAASLLEQFAIEGCFLVRESDTQQNGFTLSFFCNKKVYHCHIYTLITNNTDPRYSLKKDTSENEAFTSIYELVEHYCQNTITTTSREQDCVLQHLTEPVPPSRTHESQEWFYKDMDRVSAEKVLEKLPINGAFLCRYGSDDKNQIVISLRIENVIKHCRIKAEGRYLTVANLRFPKLEKLVDHYRRNAFYKEFKLSHPIGEELFRKSQESNSVQKVYANQEYLNSTVKTVKGRVRAIQSYKTDDPDLLSFRKGDIIINVVKEADGWWWGTLAVGSDTPKLFCSWFVEEIEDLDCPTGGFCTGSFEIGIKAKVKVCADKYRKEFGIKHYLQFKDADGTKRKLGAVCSKRRADEWAELINHVINHDKEGKLKWAKIQAAAKHNIAPEYSDLIIYCCSMDRLNPNEIGLDKGNVDVTKLKSLDEVSGGKLFRDRPDYYVWYHQYAITRIYPKAMRLHSDNFSPVPFWNFGCQMVALNYQTPDKPMQWNRGKFRQNGNCGYVLKPDFMISETQDQSKLQFDPTNLSGNETCSISLHVQIISARHLEKEGCGPISPLVEIEVVGVDADCRKFKTQTIVDTIKPLVIVDNGLNPCWNQSFSIPIQCPELALVQFSVCDMDTFSDRVPLGEATVPVTCMREGYRSVQLQNAYGEPLFSSLLVNVLKNRQN